MNSDKLVKLRQAATDATPGSRTIIGNIIWVNHLPLVRSPSTIPGLGREDFPGVVWVTPADRDFVAACDRETILDLLDRVDTLQRMLAEATLTIARLEHGDDVTKFQPLAEGHWVGKEPNVQKIPKPDT